MSLYPLPEQSNDPRYDQFMKRTLGTYLPACMREITETRPEDPIEYISRWLVSATKTDNYLRERARYLKELFYTNKIIKASREEFEAKIQPLKNATRQESANLGRAQRDELDAMLSIAELNGKKPLDNYTKNRLRYLQTVFPEDTRLQEIIDTKVNKPKEKLGDDVLEDKKKKARKKIVKIRQKVRQDIKKELDLGGGEGGEGEGEDKAEKVPSEKGESIVPEEIEEMKEEVKKDELVTKDDDQASAKPLPVSATEVREVMSGISEAIQKNQVQLTPTGLIAFVSKDLGVAAPKTQRTKSENPLDKPELWAKKKFNCEVLYDHELYSRCDADKDDPKYTKKFPKMTIEDFLAPVCYIPPKPTEQKMKKRLSIGGPATKDLESKGKRSIKASVGPVSSQENEKSSSKSKKKKQKN